MKVLALNSSPRGEGQSKTEFLLNHLIQWFIPRPFLIIYNTGFPFPDQVEDKLHGNDIIGLGRLFTKPSP